MMNTKCNHSKGDMKVEAKSSSSGSCGKFIEVVIMLILIGSYYCFIHGYYCSTTVNTARTKLMLLHRILMVDSITFGHEMVNILVSGEEYDKVFNHLDMLNAPFEGKHGTRIEGFIMLKKYQQVHGDLKLEENRVEFEWYKSVNMEIGELNGAKIEAKWLEETVRIAWRCVLHEKVGSAGIVDVRTYLLGGAIDGSEANGIIRDPKLELESSRFTFDLVPLSYESVDVWDQIAMNAEIQSMMDNMVWVLVDLPPDSRLVAKGFILNSTGLIMKKRSNPSLFVRAIRILISIAAFYDYEIWQMDVKTAFLNAYLDEDIYMVQHEGFVDLNHLRKWTGKALSKVLIHTTTAMSATEAKYIAAPEATMEAVWIRKFISGLGIVPTKNEPIRMFCDNSAALHFANEPGVQIGAIHYQRKYHYVRESIVLGEIRFLKVHTDDNLADPFMKALSKGKLTQHARSMGLRLASSFM
ncbi:retrotransposon protein, putative, ty1-copia subclass [Tanacetum coccineum]